MWMFLAQSGDVVVLPSSLTPTGVLTNVLGQNYAQILGVVGLAFVATLIVASIAIVRRRFGSQREAAVWDPYGGDVAFKRHVARKRMREAMSGEGSGLKNMSRRRRMRNDDIPF